ncbi:LytTR family DNA-binding domain-containing protein [Halomonas denitrificans]|nr:LytTR family transcriptional regulator [Halomonas denitrificans]
MNLLGALAPFRGLAAARLSRTTSAELLTLAGATVVALLVYCVGHATLTAEPLMFGRSLAWSLAHGAGLAALLAGARSAERVDRAWMLPISLVVGLGTSTAVLMMGGRLLAGAWLLPDYVTSTTYAAGAVALTWLVRPGPASERVLLVDFGTARERIAMGSILAAHGARNYAELHLVDDPRPALVRSTLSGLENECGGQLVRVQRSWLVNPDHLERLLQGPRGTLRIQLKGGLEVPVSARYAEAVRSDPRFVPARADSSPEAGREAV